MFKCVSLLCCCVQVFQAKIIETLSHVDTSYTCPPAVVFSGDEKEKREYVSNVENWLVYLASQPVRCKDKKKEIITQAGACGCVERHVHRHCKLAHVQKLWPGTSRRGTKIEPTHNVANVKEQADFF